MRQPGYTPPMSYHSLGACVRDLERTGRLVVVDHEVDPDLEMAAIQRRLYAAQGPAVLFRHVKGTPFPAVCNLFGTIERARFLFRHTLRAVEMLVAAKGDPASLIRRPANWPRLLAARHALPLPSFSPPVLASRCRIQDLPQIRSWPADGGAFITLPQVFTEHPDRPGLLGSNLGMYRVQLSGGDYDPGREVGLHYQTHRGIGVHHHAAVRRGERLRVSIFVGGPPALALSAVMPLPEGLPEVAFAGVLGGRAFRYARRDGHVLAADADFCITGTIDPARTLPEGPFGDHLGYYSLVHPFPVLEVDAVHHRRGAIWPFTVVGRPPQEDTTFGELIHEMTSAAIPAVITGLRAVHAVDATGVHPLLLAIGSERYTPWSGSRRPQEILTIANAILGTGQLSLAKYVFMAAGEDDPTLDVHDVPRFLGHVLERVDWSADLHFHTRTNMDTLDYSGGELNRGSKLVLAVAGRPRRALLSTLPSDFPWPEGFSEPRLGLPGIVAVRAPGYRDPEAAAADRRRMVEALAARRWPDGLPLVLLVDDSEFTTRTLSNLLWVAFTRSDPARDIDGAGARVEEKHWACDGPLVIDARLKPWYPPVLEEDPEVCRRVEALAAPGGPLHGLY